MSRTSVLLCAALAGGAMWLAGCRVEKTTHGDSKDVQIATPFGGVHVRTNDADLLAQIGLPAYPGAVPVKKDNGNDDNSSADVDMGFGGFRLRVKVATYWTPDQPDAVQAFYRDKIRQYGDPILCRNERAVGSPDHTSAGLTCSSEHDGHVTVDDVTSKHGVQLKSGSAQHQHVVTIDADKGGTKIGLVVLDLPSGFSDRESNDTRQ